MALYPNKFVGQDILQPGARGEKFKADIPGYRGNEDRINRTNIIFFYSCYYFIKLRI